MFWVTAGHVIKKIQELQKLPRTHYVRAQWLDHHPQEKAEAAPTSLEHLDMERIKEHGMDFGLIRIPEFDCRTLCGNPEIEPLDFSAWHGRESAEPEAYFVVGNPEEWSVFENTPRRGGIRCSNRHSCARTH